MVWKEVFTSCVMVVFHHFSETEGNYRML